ncbi:MAG: TonB-dependent receptor [Bacteroidaceae bacterium]|nr:TonB-dependent receptor [Bacteroidaceae bacterium]
MKRLCVITSLLFSVAGICGVYAQKADSTKVKELVEVTVKPVKAPDNAPFAVSKIGMGELEQFSKTGQELPFLFARTPGVLAWSENGLGTGTTYMRIRGAATSRINVTLDGVALNSPEDQCVYWVNMNSYASFLGGVQIQRGVGTSTNGDGAFGGTVALQTRMPRLTPQLEVTASYGSYNTYNVGGNFSSGLLINHLLIDGAYHHTGTDGYIHGTKGNSGSYYGGLTWLNTKGTLKLNYKNIGNYEVTGQAWNGVTAGNDDLSLMNGTYGAPGFTSYQDMYNAGLGRYNSLYERLVFDGDNYSFVKNADGSYQTERYRMNDGSPWSRTTDNFWQNHNLLNLTWRINNNWSTSGTLHYTYGHGYYDEFRYNNKLSKFGLSRTPEPGYDFSRYSDFVRQKGYTQHTYGVVWNANYQNGKWDVLGGASFQNFEAHHYGYLTYISDDVIRAYYMPTEGQLQYYDSNASKSDNQIYAKAIYHICPAWDVYADLQYRHVNYITNGYGDRYTTPDKGYTIVPQLLNIAHQFDFMNPKFGFSYHQGGHNAYVSYALSYREPERNNFTDNGTGIEPKSESVHDVELGYGYNNRMCHINLGMYAMIYRNQLVQSGEHSDIGENLTTNVWKSYRLGLELSAGIHITKCFSLEANAAISKNTITDFDECVENWDVWQNSADNTQFVGADGTGYTRIHYDNSTLAFSPTAILNGFADFHYKGFKTTWHTGYVSKQYLDNSANNERSLPGYTRTDIALSYNLKLSGKGLKNIIFGMNLNNIFNRHYASSGWVYSAICESYGHTNDNRYYQIGYVPMAGFTCMGNITLKF